MPLEKSMSRRERSRSTPCRLRITGWEFLNLSATSWAWLNDDGATTWGLAEAKAGTGRTTLWGFGRSTPDGDGSGRTADCSWRSATGGWLGATGRGRPVGAEGRGVTGEDSRVGTA